VAVYLKKRKSGSKKFIFIFIIILLVIIAIPSFMIFRMENYYLFDRQNVNLTISYNNDIYFVRSLNSVDKKIYIIKSQDKITFPETGFTVDSSKLSETTDSFYQQFGKRADEIFTLKLDDKALSEINSSMKSDKPGIEGFFDTMIYSDSSLFDFIKASGYAKIISKYDRETKVDSNVLYYFMKVFKKYSVTNYDKMKATGRFSSPLTVNVGDNKYEINEIKPEDFDTIKSILE